MLSGTEASVPLFLKGEVLDFPDLKYERKDERNPLSMEAEKHYCLHIVF